MLCRAQSMAHSHFDFGAPTGIKRQEPDYGHEAEEKLKRHCTQAVESHQNFDFLEIPTDGVLRGESSHGSDGWQHLSQHNPNSTYPYRFPEPHHLADWTPQPDWNTTLPTDFVSPQEWVTIYPDQRQGVQTFHPGLSSSTVQLYSEPFIETVPNEYISRYLPLLSAEAIDVPRVGTESPTNDQLPWLAEVPHSFDPYANPSSTWQLNDNHATKIGMRRAESQNDPSIAYSPQTLLPSTTSLAKHLVRAEELEAAVVKCQVRIVVHGFKKETVVIGDLLSDAELFFQQPSMEKCGRDIEYWNPHYLLRPGAQMPNLEDLSISPEGCSTPAGEALEEAEKNKFMRIFDDASDLGDPGVCYLTTPSPRLRSTLKQ